MDSPQSEAAQTRQPTGNEKRSTPAWAAIEEALRGLRFGTVSIIVQDGVVIQIDRTEKRRLR